MRKLTFIYVIGLMCANIISAQNIHGPLMERENRCYIFPEVDFFFQSETTIRLKIKKFISVCECMSTRQEYASLKKIGKRRFKKKHAPSLYIRRESIEDVKNDYLKIPYYKTYHTEKTDMAIFTINLEEFPFLPADTYIIYLEKKYQGHPYILRLDIDGPISASELAFFEEILRKIDVTKIAPRPKITQQ